MTERDSPLELERLDAGPGPARAQTAAAGEAQAQRILAQLGHKPSRARAVVWLAAGCLLTLGAWASIAAFERKPAAPRAGHVDAQRAPSGSASSAPLASSAPTAPSTSPRAVEVPQPARASRDWLKLANAARELRDYARARELYTQALRADPASDDAYTAGIAAADLEREHLGQVQSALERYEAALRARPRGALAEQARAGQARALRQLGQREREADAWRELLRAHPSSWFADEARARLRELQP